MNPHVQEILDKTTPNRSFLRQYGKDTLIDALIEMKNMSVNLDTINLEYEKLKMEHERVMIELDYKMRVSNNLLVYGDNIKDHQFAPKAIGDVSNSLALMWKPPSRSIKENGEAGSEQAEPVLDLEERIRIAVEDGMRWNTNNEKPKLRSTVLKKLESWEKSVVKGMNADVGDYVGKKPPSDKGFAVGICKQIEQMFGVQYQGKHIDSRFKKAMRVYTDSNKSKSGVPGDVADKLIHDFISKDIKSKRYYTEPLHNKFREIVNEHLEANASDIRGSGYDLLKKLTYQSTVTTYLSKRALGAPEGINYNMPPDKLTLEMSHWPKGEPFPEEVHKAVCVRGEYKKEYEQFWDKFCNKVGLT